MDLDVGPWTAAVGSQVLASAKEQQQEVRVNVEREGEKRNKTKFLF